MLKFFGFGAVTLATLTFLFGGNVTSYITTSTSKIKEGIQQGIPIQFEIDRARNLIGELDGEMRKNLMGVAREEVEVERLTARLTSLEDKIEEDRGNLLRLQIDIESGNTEFNYSNISYSLSEVQEDAERKLKRTKNLSNMQGGLSKILLARKRGLLALQDKIGEMREVKDQLEIDVENLQARQKMVEVSKVTSEYSFDGSRLAKARLLLDRISTRISVEEKMVEGEEIEEGEIQLDSEEEGDVSIRIATFLNPTGNSVVSE